MQFLIITNVNRMYLTTGELVVFPTAKGKLPPGYGRKITRCDVPLKEIPGNKLTAG